MSAPNPRDQYLAAPDDPEALTGVPQPSEDLARTTAHVALGLIRLPHMEVLRYGMRGNDEAVAEVGTAEAQAQLHDVLTHPGNHTREELMETMFANFSGEVYGDVQWPKSTGGWGTPAVVNQYGMLRQEYPQLAPLSLDFGFMTHLPEFMSMLEAGEIDTKDYLHARNQLKEKLGTKTLWRGLSLTNEELADIKQNGMVAPLGHTVESSDDPEDVFAAITLSTYPWTLAEKHFHNEHRSSPFMSVTGHPDVAIAVGRHYSRKTAGKEFYLFQLEVPAMDVVSYTEHAIGMPSMLKSLLDRNPHAAIKTSLDGQEVQHPWDEKVESFMFWKIDPSEIIDVTSPTVTESSWNGQVTRS